MHCVVPSILTYDSAPFPHHFGVEMHEFMWNNIEVKVSRTLILCGFIAIYGATWSYEKRAINYDS
jgi:hypothetical protein